MVPPQPATSPTDTTLSASDQRTLSQGVRCGGVHLLCLNLVLTFDVKIRDEHPTNVDQDRTLTLLPMPTVAQHTEHTYATIARKAADKSRAQEGLVGGKRGPGEVETPGPPAILSHEEAEEAKVRAGMVASVKFLIEDMPLGEKYKILGVVQLVSGLCVATAVGPGGTIVPIGARPQSEAIAPAVPFRSPMFNNDLRLLET